MTTKLFYKERSAIQKLKNYENLGINAYIDMYYIIFFSVQNHLKK